MKNKYILLALSFCFIVYNSQATIRYVNASTTYTGTPDTSWATAYTDLQPAINAASAGDTIFIASGTYKPTHIPSTGAASSTNRNLSFYLDKNIKIYGGFAGTETALSQRNIGSNPVILSGDLGSNSPTTITDDCYHVFITDGLSSAAVLDGVTITYGYAIGSKNSTISYSGSTFYLKQGGGIYNYSSSPTLTNVTISGNTAYNDGGGMYNYSSSPTLANVTISGNKAILYQGGGMYNNQSSCPTLTNVTISGNTAGSNGGGIFNFVSSSPTIKNTIFWGNAKGTTATNVAGADISSCCSLTITYSLTQENSSYGTNSANHVTSGSNPLFINASDPDGADNSWMTKDDGLNMYDISPAFHTGTSSGAPTTDITGATRGSSPSMGAYEGDITIFFADKDATGSNDGSSWTNAYTTLQPALNAASAGDEVWIASGTYKPTGYPTGVTSTNTRDYAFYLDKDIKIYGGFAGTETPLSPRNIASNPVILSGDLGSNSPTTITDDCYHVFITDGLSSAAVLDGVTITYGNANGSSTISYSGQTYNQTYGGGIYNIASSPTISNVTFLNNIASDGGGIYNNSSSNPTLNNLNIISNSATTSGGGIYTNNSLSLVNCNVLFNSASTNGGGIYNNAATSTTTTLKNSIFFGNGQSSASNRSAAGADIYFANAVPVTATNSMMQLAAIGSYTSGTKNQINTSTSNLFAVYPSFMDTTDLNGTDNAWMTYDDGLRLGTGSSAIAAGTATGAPSTDLIGEDRPSPPAIGAYEGIYCTSSKTLPTTVSTTYTSSYKSTDTNGWTNYCDASDKLLLSLDIGSSGAVIAKNAVKLKLGASTVYTSTSTGGLITNSGGYSVIDRRWSVVPTTQPSNGNVGVRSYFTAAEVSALNTALSSSSVYNSFDDLQMFKAQTNVTGGGTATAFADPHTVNGIVLINGGTASTTVWEDGTHGTSDHFAEFEVSSFSGGGGGGGANGAPLPVELVYFEAKAIDNHQALLNWQTASELNNDYFDVERSYDAIHWEWVGKVVGNGTTTQLTDYSFVDKTIAKSQQTAYYRLNQIDYDGANEYTDIRSVRFTVKPNAFEIAAYPNPFNQEVTISVSTTELYSIEVTDLSGVLLLAIQNEDKGTHRLDLSAWASGVYIVNVTSTQGTKHLKVIKQ